MKRTNIIISVILCSAIVLLLASCDGGLFKQPDDIAAVREFLIVNYTSDLDGRYSKFISYDDFGDGEAMQAHIKEFYRPLKKYFTAEFYKKVVREGRIILVDDKYSHDLGVTTHPENIEISEYSTVDAGKIYSFSLDLVRTGEVDDTVKIVGQIGVSKGKVMSVYARFG